MTETHLLPNSSLLTNMPIIYDVETIYLHNYIYIRLYQRQTTYNDDMQWHAMITILWKTERSPVTATHMRRAKRWRKNRAWTKTRSNGYISETAAESIWGGFWKGQTDENANVQLQGQLWQVRRGSRWLKHTGTHATALGLDIGFRQLLRIELPQDPSFSESPRRAKPKNKILPRRNPHRFDKFQTTPSVP